MDIIIDDQLPNKHAAKPQVGFYKSDPNRSLLIKIKKNGSFHHQKSFDFTTGFRLAIG